MLEPSPRVTVAVLQRESLGYTVRSIESLYATAGVPFDLVYVDGGSPPAVQRRIAAEATRRGFQLLRQERFVTPNQARNLALAQVKTEFVAFVDNDLIFREGWLRQLLACADETGAELTGPLICIGDPAFRKIHVAGGEVRVDETSAGPRLHLFHRFAHRQVDDVAAQLVREPLKMLELHCLLARRSLFDRIGFFDEGLRSANEHVDLCLLVARSGGTMMFEPGAVVNQYLPAPFPLDLQSLPFFYERWSSANNRATIDHFRAKWNLPQHDRETEKTLNWCNDRRDVIFRYLHPHIVRHGWRKLRRIAQSAPRLAKRVEPNA
jgi:glycosyltransferase involved in cell wall biosynthesis